MKYLLSGILLFILFILGLAKAAGKPAPKPGDPRAWYEVHQANGQRKASAPEEPVPEEAHVTFSTKRNIVRIALPITTICNRDCPECPAHRKKGEPSFGHVPLDTIKRYGETLGHFYRLEVSGGEPTLHPDFPYLAENWHNLFDCDEVMLLTNGRFPDSYLQYLPLHERVYTTHYNEKFAARHGGPVNTADVRRVGDYLFAYPKTIFHPQEMDGHVPIGSGPYSGRCMFGYEKSDMVSVFEDRIYGCCTAWQLPYRGEGIPVTKDWRDHLGEIEIPCGFCFLSGMVPKPTDPR